ncbi:MAG: hypothetical protein QXU52_03090 [Fervidicoccaceae archaeon]
MSRREEASISLDALRVIEEGKVKVLAPALELYVRPNGVPEPAWAPVFYNPAMTDNRTLTVLLVRCSRALGQRVETFVEPLAGICVRSVRALIEGGAETAYAFDANPLAVYLCHKASQLNKLVGRLLPERVDANEGLLRLDSEGVRVDAVDLDPFGSPIYYVASSARALGRGGLLIATATDLGCLEGKYPETARRRYGLRVRRTDYSKEVAARALVAAMIRQLAALERGARPVLAYYEKHYVKIALSVRHSRGEASASLEETGYLCLDESGYPEALAKSPSECDQREYMGPLWLGPIYHSSLLKELCSVGEAEVSPRLRKALKLIESEASVNSPFYYKLDSLCSRYSIGSMPSPDVVVVKLREIGYSASRTHFDPVGVKTSAPLSDVLRAIREAQLSQPSA